jgi:hypothetical protein
MAVVRSFAGDLHVMHLIFIYHYLLFSFDIPLPLHQSDSVKDHQIVHLRAKKAGWKAAFLFRK